MSVGAIVFTDLNLPPPAPRGPRMSFRVKRTLTNEPDEAEFLIYNLDERLETAAVSVFHELGKLPVTIQAGYESRVSMLFKGDLRDLKPGERSGADFYMQGVADDGGDAFSDLTVSLSSAGVSAEVMIQSAIAAFNKGDPTRGILPYPLVAHSSVETAIEQVQPGARTQTFNHVHIGKVSELLDEAARILGVRWWIADGFLYMAKRGSVIDPLAVVLPDHTWLSRPKPAGNGLTRMSAFFDPMLIPGRIVQVVAGPSKYALGVGAQTFRCEEVEVTGDTRGSEPWRANMLLRRTA
jgi:hypothetical protein